MSPFTQSLLVICVLTFLSLHNVIGESTDHQVVVHNSLEGKLNLTLRCQSKDDDLGFHDLRPDEHFDWNFNVNIFATTLYFCSVKWNNEFHHFDAFRYSRDRYRFVLDWYIKKAGPCVVSPGEDGCYPWNPNY